MDIASTSTYDYEDKSLDLDLYSDFISTENDESLIEANKKYEDLLKAFNEMKQAKEAVEKRNEFLERQNRTILENMCKLYKTAKYEMYQKNLKLKESKEHLDAVIFRRNSKYGNYSATAKKFRTNSIMDKEWNHKDCKFNYTTDNTELNDSNIDRIRENLNRTDFLQKQQTQNVWSNDSEILLNYYNRNSGSSKKENPVSGETKINKTNFEGSNHSSTKSNAGSSGASCSSIEEQKEKNTDKISPSPDDSDDDSTKLQLNNFNYQKSETVKKAEAIKRRIRRNSVSPKKNYDGKTFPPKTTKIVKRKKEIEDGEILSDSEETRKKSLRGEDFCRNKRRFNVNEKHILNGRNEYLRQLEVNRMKMKVRREKILLFKAQEEMSLKEKKLSRNVNSDYRKTR